MSDKLKENQNHKMGYLGAYTVENIESLKKQAESGGITQYLIEHADEARTVDYSHRPEGILFGCVQWGRKRSAEQFFVIRANYGDHDILVATPLPLNRDRHIDSKGIFEEPRFGDESAENLLDDLIRINPENRHELERIREAYNKRART
ncbi:MAG: hypothetical protein ABSH52_32420 [Terriglobia bacterium]|jgi:hypothetical protein